MRNSLLLGVLGMMLANGGPGPQKSQPAGTNQTVEILEPGYLAQPIWFEWRSGWTVDVFLAKIKTTFGFDLRAAADIPQQMLQVGVPSMKINTQRVWDVLLLYNQIAKDYPQIGRWVWHFPTTDWRGEPSAVYLVPPKQTDAEEALSVRAFTLRDIPEPEQKQLFELINVEAGRLKLETEKGIKASLLRGDIHFHTETGICVATGGKPYVEMVASLIDAFREGRGVTVGPYRPYP